MTLRVSGLITMDGKQAKAELVGTKKSIDQVTGAAKKLNTEGKRGAQGVDALGDAADRATVDLKQMSAAERQAAVDAKGVGQASGLAAGQVGNLTANFNDVGVMMMAGQNPLQLAIQQGTQITQVIGPMGAAGAVKALKAAFLSMLAPINFITIGAIAAGAALANWLTSAADQAETFEERVEALKSAVDAYRESTQLAIATEEKLRGEFGSSAELIRQINALGSETDRRSAIALLNSEAEKLVKTFGEIDGGFLVRTMGGAVHEFKNARATARELKSEFGITKDEANKIVAALHRLGQAQGFREQAEAAAEVQRTLLGIYGTAEKIPEEFAAAASQARVLATEATRLKALDAARLGLIKAVSQEWQASGRAYLQTRIAEETKARDLLATLNHQASTQALITQFGEDSRQVAEHRAAAEREAYRGMLDTLAVSDALKVEMLAAFDAVASNKAQTHEWAAAMSGVAAEVRGILSALASIGGSVISNAAKTIEVEALRAGKSVADARVAAVKSQIDAEYKARDQGASNWFDKAANWADREVKLRGVALDQELAKERSAAAKREAARNRSGGGGGGGGRAAATNRETDAIARLIEREREQLAILRETDPVQKELLRNRDALRGATDAERAAVTALIAERIREKQALEQAQEAEEFFRDSIYEGLEGAMLRGEGFADVLRNTVIPALLKAALLGEGPLGGLFGGTGLLQLIFPGAFARGGYITGPGGAKEDKVPIMASAGEYMVNSAATRRHRHLLEHINAGGEVAGFARGGIIGGGAAPSTSSTSPRQREAGVMNINVRGTGGDEILQATFMAIEKALEHFNENTLAERVRYIVNDKWAS